jgi:SAM-dependent methyltransferase
MGTPFDENAENYDRWYETPEGAAVLQAEIACLRRACPTFAGAWIEVGVGTGRFSAALGIAEGVDPSPAMRDLATSRGVRAQAGTAEELPYPAGVLDGVLLVATLCFIHAPPVALSECARVLRPGGTLLIGHIPSDGAWGRSYIKKANEGHPVYSHARFSTVAEVLRLSEMADFALDSGASTLFETPGHLIEGPPRVEQGIATGAGFVALRLHKGSALRKDCT